MRSFNAFALLALPFVSACSLLVGPGPTPEGNFRSIISSKVGKPIGSVGYPVTTDRQIDEKTHEYEYACCAPGCRYWYVVDKTTSLIQSWRSEGPCRIPP